MSIPHLENKNQTLLSNFVVNRSETFSEVAEPQKAISAVVRNEDI